MKNGKLTDEDAMHLLQDVSQKDVQFLNLGKISTQWSAVYNSKKCTVTITTGMDYKDAYEFHVK